MSRINHKYIVNIMNCHCQKEEEEEESRVGERERERVGEVTSERRTRGVFN